MEKFCLRDVPTVVMNPWHSNTEGVTATIHSHVAGGGNSRAMPMGVEVFRLRPASKPRI